MSRRNNRNRQHGNSSQATRPDAELAREFAPQIREFALLGRNVFGTRAPHDAPRLTVEDAVVFERVTKNDSPRFIRELWIPEEHVEAFAAQISEETFDKQSKEDEKAGTAKVRNGGFIRRQHSILEADLGGEFRSLVTPATRRFKPVPGAENEVVVSWNYHQDRHTGQWKRNGMALPYDLERVHKSIYVPPPATAEKWEVTLVPATDEHGNVTPTLILEEGYVLELKRTHAYVLKGKWGTPILVRIGNEDPRNRTLMCTSQTVIGSALGAAEEVDDPVVCDDEVLVQGRVLKVWDVLKPYGATDAHGKRKLTSLRREMEKKLHPDSHGPSRAFKALGQSVPDAVENKRKLDLDLYRAAFARAEEIAVERFGEDGGLNDPDPKATEAPAKVEPTPVAAAESTTPAVPAKPKAPRRPASTPSASSRPRRPSPDKAPEA